MNTFDQVEYFERDPLMELLLTIEIISKNGLNY